MAMINISVFMHGENQVDNMMQKKKKNTKNRKRERMLICKL